MLTRMMLTSLDTTDARALGPKMLREAAHDAGYWGLNLTTSSWRVPNLNSQQVSDHEDVELMLESFGMQLEAEPLWPSFLLL